MEDARLYALAGSQHGRVSLEQLLAIGATESAIRHRVVKGRLIRVHAEVFGLPPLGSDPWSEWMAASLSSPTTSVSHHSAITAFGMLELRRPLVSVTRPGSGGPRRCGRLLIRRSACLEGELTELSGVRMTKPERTLIDMAPLLSERALARAVREGVRLGLTSLSAIAEALGRHRGRRGALALGLALARYSGLPIERARSGAEVRALEVLKGADRPLPDLNMRRGGEEADLSWPASRLIIEIDGSPYHLDRGEDRRKEEAWCSAGWLARRISSNEVYEAPSRLIALFDELSVQRPAR